MSNKTGNCHKSACLLPAEKLWTLTAGGPICTPLQEEEEEEEEGLFVFNGPMKKL